MDKHSDNIWQRRSARQILKTAKERLRKAKGTKEEVAARIQYASDTYALWKRYFNPLGFPLLAVNIFRSNWHARIGLDLAWRWCYSLSPDQADILATIFRKSPKPFKDLASASHLIEMGINNPSNFESTPHTKALLWIGKAEVEIAEGSSPESVENYYRTVLKLRPAIVDKQQACRVDAALAFYFLGLKWPEATQMSIGRASLMSAFRLAREVSRDQYLKLIAECKKRNISIPE